MTKTMPKSKLESKTASNSSEGYSTRPKPTYQQIKESILKRIHSGQWQAGDTIPTEHLLAKEFSVSRMTVNRALKELSDDRVLLRRQGSGTFVAQQQFNHTYVEVRNIAADIKAANKKYEAKVISQRCLLASEISPYILARFNAPMLDEIEGDNQNGAESYRSDIAPAKLISTKRENNNKIDEVKIVHIADGKPVQFEERWVDSLIVPKFGEQDFSITNTSDYLISQAPLEGGSYTIRAIAATQEVADALDMELGEPALLLSRQTYSAGQVVTFVNMWYVGGEYQFSGTL